MNSSGDDGTPYVCNVSEGMKKSSPWIKPKGGVDFLDIEVSIQPVTQGFSPDSSALKG